MRFALMSAKAGASRLKLGLARLKMQIRRVKISMANVSVSIRKLITDAFLIKAKLILTCFWVGFWILGFWN